MKKYIILLIIIIPLSFSNCSDNGDEPTVFPTTQEQIIEAVMNTNLIAEQGGKIIEDAISNAYYSNGLIDPNEIVDQIRNISGVESAETTPSETAIVIKQDDGTYTNLLIVTQNDERLFIENAAKSNSIKMKSLLIAKENLVLPNGDGKALILAPFHSDFNENLEQISKLLSSAGFEVETYEDADADLTKFNGEFLNNYDVIYISTHGAADLKTRGGEKSTVLLTGEKYTSNKTKSLSNKEQNAIATGSPDGVKVYYAISVPWIKITATQNFSNSWVYADACESAMIDNGTTSLSEAFLDLGAVGYNGFDATINSTLANPIAEKMVARFSSGLSFTDASEEVLNDWGLKAKAWALRLIAKSKDDDAIRVELFDYNKKINDPFYIKHPDDVVGISKVIPEAGTVGTSVIFEVTINEEYISQVASIEFDIDNTGEHLTMSNINANIWQRNGLSAPSAETYPRVDTFTFSAFDSNKNLIGQGSATFSILEKSLSNSSKFRKSKYYAN